MRIEIMKTRQIQCLLLAFLLLGFNIKSHALSEESYNNGVPSLGPMLTHVTPAVVSINVRKSANSRRHQHGNRFFNQRDPNLRRFFERFGRGRRGLTPQHVNRSGSGVIVNAAEGYIITNHHVIDGADQIKVVLKDQRRFDAKLIGSDPDTDIALLQIEGDKLVELVFANNEDLQVGDYVVAIGNPFGLGQTVTSGIVSALGRSNLNIERYENFIQTDAAINVGNSGGALVDLNGNLVGINTAILNGGSGNLGVGFAVPVDMVATIMGHLQRDGEVRHGMLGVLPRTLTEDLEASLQTGAKQGVLIIEVMPGSAAELAGIESADVIVAIDGKSISSDAELRNIIALLSQGDAVEVQLYRDGHRKTIKVELGARQSVATNLGPGSDARKILLIVS